MSWLIKSSIGRKFVMSISGIFLILFLLFHMSMNLTLIFSVKSYDKVCELLGANWYAIIGSLILASGFIVHIIYGIILTIENRKARGNDRYAVRNKTKNVEWSSKNMFVLGLIILLFLVLHMYQFWYPMQFKELIHDPTAVLHGSDLVIPTFRDPIYVAIYLLTFIALWFHLTHGFWSALHTIGLDNNNWIKRIKLVSYFFATLIWAGFSVVPVYFCFFSR